MTSLSQLGAFLTPRAAMSARAALSLIFMLDGAELIVHSPLLCQARSVFCKIVQIHQHDTRQGFAISKQPATVTHLLSK